ncbi:MAG TPA: metallophosphoesterase [Puia sp.]
MAKTYVIGDIHGALKALEQVIKKINLQKEDRLIFLGDYVDGWSQSQQVIQFLMELDKKQDCTFIKGNHDAWCEEWLSGEDPEETWVIHGGQATIDSYRPLTKRQKNVHLAFLSRMRPYYIDEVNRLFIHAGFCSMRGPAHEHFESNCYWDRTLWETALALDNRIGEDSIFYPKRLLLYPEIYIGHTPTVNYGVEEPMHAYNVWNIDTGAAFDGRLSALNIETKEFWQSDIVQQLYPGEKGRNK